MHAIERPDYKSSHPVRTGVVRSRRQQTRLERQFNGCCFGAARLLRPTLVSRLIEYRREHHPKTSKPHARPVKGMLDETTCGQGQRVILFDVPEPEPDLS
jgi:hypothetical protein